MLDVFTAVTVQLQNAWFRLQDEESGQGLVEYALIIVVVSLGSLVALKFLRNSISDLFNKAGSSIQTGAN
jgi:Flp pilus assembly pilin Flp